MPRDSLSSQGGSVHTRTLIDGLRNDAAELQEALWIAEEALKRIDAATTSWYIRGLATDALRDVKERLA